MISNLWNYSTDTKLDTDAVDLYIFFEIFILSAGIGFKKKILLQQIRIVIFHQCVENSLIYKANASPILLKICIFPTTCLIFNGFWKISWYQCFNTDFSTLNVTINHEKPSLYMLHVNPIPFLFRKKLSKNE